MMQPPPYGSSYDKLLARLWEHMRDQGTDQEILQLLRNAVAGALQAQNLVLSPPESQRLSQAAMKAVLNRMLKQVDQEDHA